MDINKKINQLADEWVSDKRNLDLGRVILTARESFLAGAKVIEQERDQLTKRVAELERAQHETKIIGENALATRLTNENKRLRESLDRHLRLMIEFADYAEHGFISAKFFECAEIARRHHVGALAALKSHVAGER